MEAVLKEKFIKLVRNMPLEIVKDTLSEDQVSLSQGSEQNGANFGFSDVEFDYDIYAEGQDQRQRTLCERVCREANHSFSRLLNFFIDEIMVKAIRQVECVGLIIMTVFSQIMRCQLEMLKSVLRCVKAGICCMGNGPKCFNCCRRMFCGESSSGKGAGNDGSRRQRNNGPPDTSGDDTTDHEGVDLDKQPLLIFISIENTLVHVSQSVPKFEPPFSKPHGPTTSLPFKITISEGSDESAATGDETSTQALYITPRPYLPKFLENMSKLGEKAEVVLHSSYSPHFVREICKWIDGEGWTKHRFYGANYNEYEAIGDQGIKAGHGVITGNLIRDVEVMYRKITEKKDGTAHLNEEHDHTCMLQHHLTCRNGGVQRIINDIDKSCERIEDEIREHAIMASIYDEDDNMVREGQSSPMAKSEINPEEDLLRNPRYVKQVRTPLQKKAMIIAETTLPKHSFYRKNLVTIKQWRNDNPRDQVLLTCERIIDQLVKAPRNVSRALPQLVGLAKSLGQD